jgi:hypothetical protein
MKKVHHAPDYVKNKTADVIKKDRGPIVSHEHWQMNLDLTPAGRGNDPAGAFLPRAGKDRAVPHVKVNECDH